MKIKGYLQKSSGLFAENQLLKFAIVVIALAFCFNSFQVFRAVRYQRTVLIPPKMTGTIEFVKGKPTDTYLRDMSRRIAHLAATYSPSTVRGNFEELLYYFAPESYPQAAETWYSLASRAEESLVSSVFYLEKIEVDTSTIEIFGQLKQFASDTLFESATKTYLVDYRIQDGRFYIIALREKALRVDAQRKEEKKQ